MVVSEEMYSLSQGTMVLIRKSQILKLIQKRLSPRKHHGRVSESQLTKDSKE